MKKAMIVQMIINTPVSIARSHQGSYHEPTADLAARDCAKRKFEHIVRLHAKAQVTQ
jgi:hypothetical protein